MTNSDFANYCLDFYAKDGIYDMGVTRDDVLVAMGIRIERRKDIECHGDTFDREAVRDILINEFNYKWPVA